MTLPEPLLSGIAVKLREAGDEGPIAAVRTLRGGDINQAARIETDRDIYFVKWLADAPPHFFEREAHGLRRLSVSSTSRVPHVIGLSDAAQTSESFLILEWIDTTNKSTYGAETLGRQLADMHRIRQPYYGHDGDNYIGKLPQPNSPSDSWIEFFRTQRLGAQLAQAQVNGVLPAYRRQALERLMQNLSDWITETECQPSLLHGDLWSGNWIQAASGEPVLIDPAVYYGDREADLAMTTLFGGFPQQVYDAYHETFPLAPSYRDRQPLYQLYYLLCHLNLFGESYGSQIDTILKRYIG